MALGEAGAGVFEVASDMFDPDAEFAWMRTIARETGRPVTFGCLQDDLRPEHWRRLIQLADESTAEGARIVPQVAGRPASVLFGWDSTAHPFLFHQTWQAIAGLPRDERLARLRDPETRQAMVDERVEVGGMAAFITQAWHKLYPLGDPPEYEPGPDASVQAIAAREGRSPQEVTYDLMLADDGRGLLYIPLIGYAHGDFGALHDMLVHPGTVLGLGDGGAHCGLLCDASLPTYMLTHWARDRDRGARLGLERAVHKQTRETAALYGFDDRGLLAPGYLADVNVIDFDALRCDAPEMAYDLPAGGRRLIQRAHGYAATVKRGVVVREDDEATGRAPGRPAPRPPAGALHLNASHVGARACPGVSALSAPGLTWCGTGNAPETRVRHAADVVGALTGHTIGITGHRRWEEQAEMLTRRGAQVVHGPVMHTTLLHDSDATVRATEQALLEPPHMVVLTTGIGTRSWFAAAESAGLDGGLRDVGSTATVLARGPKARSAAIGAGLDVDWQAADETSAEVLAHLADVGVAGRRVIVQRDGGDPLLADGIRSLGAEVVDVPVYRWHLPEVTAPAIRLIEAACAGRLDAVTFTCAYAVTNTFALAPEPEALPRRPVRAGRRGRGRPGVRGRAPPPRRGPGRRARPGPARRHGQGARGRDGADPPRAPPRRRRPRVAGVGPRRRRVRRPGRAHPRRGAAARPARHPGAGGRRQVGAGRGRGRHPRRRGDGGPAPRQARSAGRRDPHGPPAGLRLLAHRRGADGGCGERGGRQRPTRVGSDSTLTAHCL